HFLSPLRWWFNFVYFVPDYLCGSSGSTVVKSPTSQVGDHFFLKCFFIQVFPAVSPTLGGVQRGVVFVDVFDGGVNDISGQSFLIKFMAQCPPATWFARFALLNPISCKSL